MKYINKYKTKQMVTAAEGQGLYRLKSVLEKSRRVTKKKCPNSFPFFTLLPAQLTAPLRLPTL